MAPLVGPGFTRGEQTARNPAACAYLTFAGRPLFSAARSTENRPAELLIRLNRCRMQTFSVAPNSQLTLLSALIGRNAKRTCAPNSTQVANKTVYKSRTIWESLPAACGIDNEAFQASWARAGKTQPLARQGGGRGDGDQTFEVRHQATARKAQTQTKAYCTLRATASESPQIREGPAQVRACPVSRTAT